MQKFQTAQSLFHQSIRTAPYKAGFAGVEVLIIGQTKRSGAHCGALDPEGSHYDPEA
jgi:hypothetical protein